MSHAELCQRAVRWLRAKGCRIVLTEFYTSGEIPDAIGWRGTFGESYLIECKTSRSDFQSDAKKVFRQLPETGLGQFRYFMCEPNLIRTDELPPKWGLLYAGERVTIEAGRDPLRYELDGSTPFRFVEYSGRGERTLLLSALRRLQLTHGEGILHEQMHASLCE